MATTFGANDPSTLEAVVGELRKRAENLRASSKDASTTMSVRLQSSADTYDIIASDLEESAAYGARSQNESIPELQRLLGIRPYEECRK